KMSFLEYINQKTVVFLKNEELFSSAIDTLFKKATEAFNLIDSEIKRAKPSELFCTSELLKTQLNDFRKVQLKNSSISDSISISFSTKPQPSINKQFNLLNENLNDNSEKGYKNYIFCSSQQQAKRFRDIFEDISTPLNTGSEQNVKQFETIVFPLFQGFIDDDLKIVCYTDHQIFERYHKFKLKNGYAKKKAI